MLMTPLKILATASAYTALGWFGLILAIPPGYASPIFPASGMAVALALHQGTTILPGIWLGAFIINLVIPWQQNQFSNTSILTASFVASGSALQAYCAGLLAVRISGNAWKHLETERDIALFLVFTGPVACLISASTGTFALYAADILKHGDWLLSWWNWWLGDTLGVMVFTPVTLTLLMRNNSPWKERIRTIAIPMILTICLVYSTYFGVTRWDTGIVALLFATLLQVMMLSMTGRTAVIEKRVHEQTLEVSRAKAQLERLNQSLQERVNDSVSALRQQDQILISQSRQAAMGEMIGNIAHQWRQPLNALAMLITNIQLAQHDNELTNEYLDESAETANRLIQKMSATITDFRNFFSPDKEIVTFSALEQIAQTEGLVHAAFKNSNISINVDGSRDIKLLGFPNEFSQVLLNLLDNAKDAMLDKGFLPGRIDITLEDKNEMGVVTVRDNGGGIADAVLDKIFEPYFSTKKMGTGIGLYMSKMIIERSMGGTITAQNVKGGCEFNIAVPMGAHQP